MAGRRAQQARHSAARSQQFLRTDALASELVRDADVGPGDVVLDLGSGSGRLTAPLAESARHVIAVELDPYWVTRLRGRWPNVEVVEGDAATTPLPDERFRVVANLPFDRTTEILRHLLDDPRVPLTRADVVVEWGVAVKRSLPWPSTLNDVLWGAWYRFTLLRRLPRTIFDPAPEVDAGVLAIERRPVSLVDEARWLDYRQFAASGFRHGLRSVLAPSVLNRLRGTTPRDLDAHQWAELFRTTQLPSARASRRDRRLP